MKQIASLIVLAGVALAAPSTAGVIVDQTGAVEQGYAAQRFESGFNAFDVAVIDDFTLSGATKLTSVTAQFFSNSQANASGFSVELYSSQAAALASLTGDVSSFNFAPGSFIIAGNDVTIAFSKTLAAGTYWVAVIPTLTYGTYGQSFIGTRGVGNALQVNPNGGFGLGAGGTGLGTNLAFRLEGSAVPEPASWALLVAGFGLTGAAMRRRKNAVTA